jgi:hypothetical protein
MPPKKFKPKKKRNRKEEALARLKASWQKDNPDEEWEAESEPVITPLLKSVEGGIPRVIEALRAHDDDDAAAFIAVHDSLTLSDRSCLTLEAIAFASGIGSLRLAEVAQTALFLYASMQTKLLISSSMPKVAKSIVKAATDEVPITAYNSETGTNEVVGKTNGDVKAMELFGKMSGMVPIPKGAQIAIQNNFDGGEKQEKPALTGGAWKDSGERLREFHDMTEPKRLPSPVAPPINIGGRIDHMQAETAEILRGE